MDCDPERIWASFFLTKETSTIVDHSVVVYRLSVCLFICLFIENCREPSPECPEKEASGGEVRIYVDGTVMLRLLIVFFLVPCLCLTIYMTATWSTHKTTQTSRLIRYVCCPSHLETSRIHLHASMYLTQCTWHTHTTTPTLTHILIPIPHTHHTPLHSHTLHYRGFEVL